MPKQTIDTGTLALNGADGDTNRDAADKINANFTELYNANENFVRGAGAVPGGALVVFAGTTGNQVAAAAGGAPGTAAFRNASDFASAAQGAKADNAQAKLSPGDGILIDNTDPLNPIISVTATGGGDVATVAGVAPFGGDVPAAELVTALGIDQKLGSTATAAAAEKLATARTINGEAFDGTANITVADGTKEPIVAGGTVSQYWNGLKAWADFATSVRASVLTGLSLATGTAITAADSVLSALGKLQVQVSGKLGANEKAADSDKLNGQTASFYTTVMQGATSGAAGLKGLVPAPAQLGANPRFLADDGTFKEAGASSGGLAVGSMTQWKYSRATIPGGQLPLDGQIVTNGRTLYPDLWALIQPFCVTDAVWLAAPYTSRGLPSSGNGSTDFRLPDDNGKHPDGLTIAAMVFRGDGKNSAGTPGLHQADQMQGFRVAVPFHAFPGAAAQDSFGKVPASEVDGTGTSEYGAGNTAVTNGYKRSSKAVNDGVNGVPRTGTETRSASTTGIWCIVAAKTAVNAGTVDIPALATAVSNQGSQVQNLDASLGFALIYPNGNAGAPGTFAINTRMLIDNPFPGSAVIPIAEVLFNGVWAEPGFVFVNGASGYGTKASQVYGTGQIAIQSGGIQLVIASAQGGGGHGSASNGSGPLPVRLKVWRVKG